MVNDGEKEGGDGYFIELAGQAVMQIDLGFLRAARHLGLALSQPGARLPRRHRAGIDSKDFVKGVQTVFNNDHDNSSARRGQGQGVHRGGGGRSSIEGIKDATCALLERQHDQRLNHYVEIEIYGTPPSDRERFHDPYAAAALVRGTGHGTAARPPSSHVLAALASRGFRWPGRPAAMHHDEANQAVKFGELLETATTATTGTTTTARPLLPDAAAHGCAAAHPRVARRANPPAVRRCSGQV